ncbi:MAG: hypothetical protein M3P18_03090, partial [Actinomycetota bacterium]|nr:hypothetical protein [Actinomycetota bacterium]
ASVGVPIAESAVVTLLVVGQARAAAALALGLIAIFSLALLHARQEEGDRLPCGCFGRVIPRDYRLLAARNAALAALAATVLFSGRDRLVTASLGPDSTVLLPAALVILGLSVAVWVSRELAETSRRQ